VLPVDGPSEPLTCTVAVDGQVTGVLGWDQRTVYQRTKHLSHGVLGK
jgi:hypothetical protein